MNDMDESMDIVETSQDGISRRNMIKASVAAGALVWSAPLLLSGTAYAQDEDCPCAPAGTLVRLNISSEQLSSANCGNVACLAARDPGLAVVCGTREAALANCIISDASDLMVFVDPTQFNAGLATLDLSPLITVVSVAVTHQAAPPTGGCIYTDCGAALSTAQNSGPANTTDTGTARSLPNQVWVTAGGTLGGQRINIDTIPAGQGNQDNILAIDLLLCVSNGVTGMC